MARKEFSDHLRSRNFLLITAILLLICTVGLVGGITDYQKSLNSYNEDLTAAGSDIEVQGFMPERPSVLSVFTSVGSQLIILGAILGIALGFDLITKEKESKSLKLLLSHPIYRDEVINGKALGSAAALLLPLGAVLAIALALLLVIGIVPDLTEFVLVLAFGGVTALMILTYFGVALLMSTIAGNSGTALIYSIIVFVIFAVLVPVAMNDTVMSTVVGEPPEFPAQLISRSQASSGAEASRSSFSIDTESEVWQQYREAIREYGERRSAVNDVVKLFSPSLNYEAILGVSGGASKSVTVTAGGGGGSFVGMTSMDPVSGASGAVKNVVALIAFTVTFFGLAYFRFMRLDIR
ncbi:ABC transporter permease [Methanoculleus sp. Wushi-C6]|uniref:ABC transporter permease n=2 Tax=Methanoculleus caldifontis TaxID=2651577 RepID=A0ABU3X1X6_9EURY|nr:ABC transporter permease [Methanoculleus sp. Wushi-C6]